MIRLGKVIGTQIDRALRRIKAQILGGSDVQTPYEASGFGIDTNPPINTRALVMQSEGQRSYVIGYINTSRIVEVGGNRIYSTDENGELATDIIIRANGTIEIAGDSDYMVRYSALEASFNELKADFNNLVQRYNSHIHTTTATVGGGPTPGLIASTGTTATPSNADISGAKIETIKTN